MLVIKDFSFTYPNGKNAVSNLNLEIKFGDLFAFIGHNGAGKTTTIKSIVGVLDYSVGEILIDGVSIKENPLSCKSKMAYIPDNPDLYNSLTGIQFLNFIADVYKIPSNIRKERIIKYADKFELTKDLGLLISSYSHGMKQKLALISAFIHEPKILIMDEPFVGLDPKATFIVKNIMKEFCSLGGAIFFSTHILEVAQKLCNKIAIIKDGKVIISGSMDEITKNGSLEDIFMESINHE